jgi:response regulator RpfG family c-di-GMP phosphodiesterase
MKKPSPSASRLSAKDGEKILVVDDDARVLDLLQITLSGRGFDVVTANSAREALRRVDGARPNLMVLDVHLGEDDGLEVLSSVRERMDHRRLPVILISSTTSSEAKLEGFRAGADDFVAKPFSPRELILRIRRILDRIEESADLARRVRTLEHQVARGELALEESRADMRSRLFRVGSILTALQEVGEARDLDALLGRFVAVATGYLDLGVTGLFLLDEAAGAYVCRAGRGWSGGRRHEARFSAGSPLVAALTGSDRTASLAALESRPETYDEAAALRSAGFAFLHPVMVENRLRGAIGFGVGGDAEHDTADRELVSAVARSVGVALRNQGAISAIQRSFLETSSSLIHGLESRYAGLDGHSHRVSEVAVALARRVGLTESEMETVRLGAQLHDLGLVELYEHLGREVALTDEARRQVAEAPVRAAVTIAESGPLEHVAAIVRHHHEHWDGTGYPDALAGESIPIGARIVSVANAYDALTHERPYRGAYTATDALTQIREAAGTEFDPGVVRELVSVVTDGEVPVG